MRKRSKSVEETCEANDGLTGFDPNAYMVSLSHRLILCPNAKAGSTSLIYYFQQLEPEAFSISRFQENFETPMALNAYADAHDMITFSFVRHPLDRLVSAFEEKFMLDKPYLKLSEKVNGNFTAFIDLVINDVSRYMETLTGTIDPRWRPYYLQCDYCNIKFHVIGKVETFEEDIRNVFEQVGLDRQFFGPDSETVHGNQVDHANNWTEQYLALLSEETKWQLYELYRYDFELFDYEFHF